jgi:hypothetical protein
MSYELLLQLLLLILAVCCNNFKSEAERFVLPCGDVCCIDCLKQNICRLINMKNVEKIKCFNSNCKYLLSPVVVNSLIDNNDLKQQYKNEQENYYIRHKKNMRLIFL